MIRHWFPLAVDTIVKVRFRNREVLISFDMPPQRREVFPDEIFTGKVLESGEKYGISYALVNLMEIGWIVNVNESRGYVWRAVEE